MVSLYLNSIAQEDIYASVKAKEYARHLLDAGKCDLALQEIQRLSYFERLDETELNVGLQSFLCLGNNQGLLQLYQKADSSALNTENKNLYGAILVLNRQFETFDSWRKGIEDISPRLVASRFILNDDWEDLALEKSGLKDSNTLDFITQNQREYDAIRFKKPFVAATLSTLIPGSGKFYTGEWKDGVFTMILVGVVSWQTTRLFQNNGVQSVLGWSGAVVGTGLYLSNILGSYRSAKNVNIRKLKTIHESIEDHLRSGRF